MAGKDRRARAGRTYLDWQFGDTAFRDASQDLGRFDHHSLFLTRNIRDDILDNIKRGHVAARTRDTLHRSNDHRIDAERPIERLQRDRKTDRRAVGQRRDIALPAAPAALLVDEHEVVEIYS